MIRAIYFPDIGQRKVFSVAEMSFWHSKSLAMRLIFIFLKYFFKIFKIVFDCLLMLNSKPQYVYILFVFRAIATY